MPRKSLPRAFKLVCKHYKGFDRHFATKAIATRKLHASQGVFVNHKLAATSDGKLGKNTSKPLVRTYSSFHPSFAAQPVSAHTRSAARLASYQPASASTSAQPHQSAPSFAATPVWQNQQGRAGQAGPSSSSSFDGDVVMAEASPIKLAAVEELRADPVYQYATMARTRSAELKRKASMSRTATDRSALKWYGSLDRRPLPISKASGASSKPSQYSSDRSRVAAAFAAYADLDGPKH